jgi:hypothetical protein
MSVGAQNGVSSACSPIRKANRRTPVHVLLLLHAHLDGGVHVVRDPPEADDLRQVPARVRLGLDESGDRAVLEDPEVAGPLVEREEGSLYLADAGLFEPPPLGVEGVDVPDAGHEIRGLRFDAADSAPFPDVCLGWKLLVVLQLRHFAEVPSGLFC